jgi:phosphoheptose isomerase
MLDDNVIHEDHVFERQVLALGRRGDAFSASLHPAVR